MRKKKTRITVLDIAIALILLGAGVYVFYRIRVGLNYHWNWGVIPQYLFRYDEEKHRWVMNLLMEGLKTTLALSVWSILFATIVGSIMGMFRVSSSLFKRLIGRTYVELIRNIPPLVLVFIFYFFLSDQIMPVLGVDDFIRSRSERFQEILAFFSTRPELFSTFLSAVITIGLFEGAYITEIVRGGIQSIERGQWEASYALGLSWWQQMRHVVLPQAVQRILPPMAGEFINTIKNSSIVSVISIQELTFQGMELMAASLLTFEVWLTIAGMYLVVCLLLSLAVARLEVHMRRSLA
ncbi:MAG: amino acid ABC transporter permease [Deltaproteobacteria bacterium]|nr:amino acid ABC transporter permease [Deltaproteobacteria bacterium]MBW2120630.1 amino acid ABC transporter permease [Deltaproteobacteria bacterium]